MKKTLCKFGFRKVALAVADAFIVAVAGLISNFILNQANAGIGSRELLNIIILSIMTCFGGLFICGAYNKLWRYFNKKDYLSCVHGVVLGIISGSFFMFLLHSKLHPVFIILHTAIIIIGICLFRYIFKTTFIDLTRVGRDQSKYKRTMMIGGGKACRMLLNEIHNAQTSPYTEDKASAMFEPVCIIDDDRSKIGQTVKDVQIVGTTAEIEKFVKEMDIEQIIFCIPSCLKEERKRILDICSKTDLPVKVIPFIGNLIFNDENTTLLGQMRDIKVEDLLGRDPIKFDNKDIKEFIGGKVCMVTGGGGSIGSELVRQIAKYHPEKIIIIDICENYAYDVQQEMRMEYGDELDLTVRIASVRDYYRMDQIFRTFKPDIVFHAAAHKHVPLMEDSPMEAIKNNVIGTFNVATLAQFHNVETFVMVSTDKAVNPTNVMGASKRCCEMIVQYLSQQPDSRTEFVTTRFGNVLGSHGSVIPLFKRQIETGRPVTVTHPDIVRYFMTIPEAVSLVMEAAAIAHGGEIFVLDMGQPVKIVTLAENLIRMYGKVPYKDVKIEFTGLRPGEKIKEELLMNEEGLQKTDNELIFIGQQIQIDDATFIHDLTNLRDAAQKNDAALTVAALHKMVPTFVTPEEYNNQYLVTA
ncbi:MAG: polysaccharide biosynthesis protein [Ruminococcus sp.]|nr:polysaccharide biosynthesis protein [Ruminococcus sp.]